ncbi:MAG TPA: SIS domain-containing protein [Candidatus Sulfotelmatobacter sp.]|nr:SIS domain-containing protein [Candidatus Sulfotelmatobacter sp.]
MLGSRTRREILNQPTAWRTILDQALPRYGPALRELMGSVEEVLLVGSGSAYHVAELAAPTFIQWLRLPARALLSPDIFLDPDATLVTQRRYGLIAISRSGETTEALRALEVARERGFPTAAITVKTRSTITSQVQLPIVLEPLDEGSVAATQSVSGMALFLVAAAGQEAALVLTRLRRLPDLAERQMATWEQAASAMAGAIDAALKGRHLVFLGSGRLAAVAAEAQLKAIEMAGIPASAHALLNYRHGPQAMLDEDLLVLLTNGDSPEESDFIREMGERGGRLWVVTDQATALHQRVATWVTEMGEDLSSIQEPIAFLPLLQLFAHHAALAAGRDPDRPRHLDYSVRWH